MRKGRGYQTSANTCLFIPRNTIDWHNIEHNNNRAWVRHQSSDHICETRLIAQNKILRKRAKIDNVSNVASRTTVWLKRFAS